MNPWVAVLLMAAVAIISGVLTYLCTRLRIAKESAQQAGALAEAVTALEGGENTKKVQTGFIVITPENLSGEGGAAAYKSNC